MSNETTQVPTVAFIGLGNMGRPMALRLVRAGLDVAVFDLAHDAVAELVEAGATACSSAGDCADGRETVITVLPDTEVVASIALGADGFLKRLSLGAVVVDMSTGDPSVYPRMAPGLAEAGATLIDGPVSGGVRGAVGGTLSIMVGGSEEALAMVSPVLQHLGTPLHLGVLGTGQVAKLCNQVIVALHLQAACEGFTLARAAGLDLKVLSDVLSQGAAQSWLLDNLGPKMTAGEDDAGFRISLQLKDLRIATQFAHSLNVPLPAANGVTTQYLEAVAHDEGSNGNQSLFRVYERLANRTLR